MKICSYKSRGIRCSVFRVIAVNVVAAEGVDLFSLIHLRRLGPGLCKLACHSCDTYNGLIGTPDQNQAHLQQELDFRLNSLLLAVVEELRTITALQ